MPEELRQKIIEAIAASGDENYKRMMMLLLRVEESFFERVDHLAEQMTVPAHQHTEDHDWIKSARRAGRGVQHTAFRMIVGGAERGGWIVATLVAAKWFGWHV